MVISKILYTKYAVIITSTNYASVYKLQHNTCDILMCARSWTDGELAGWVGGATTSFSRAPRRMQLQSVRTGAQSAYTFVSYVRPQRQAGSSWAHFRQIWYKTLWKSLEEEHYIWLKPVRNTWHFPWPQQVLLPPAPLRHRMNALLPQWCHAVTTCA